MKKQKQALTPEERKIKKMVIRARTLIAFTIIFLILLAAAFIASFIDKKTPQIVYFIGIMLLAGIETLFGTMLSCYSAKLKRELGIVGDDKGKGALAKKSAANYKIKDKTYKILTSIGFFGDAVLGIGVIFLASQAAVPVEVKVVSILLGALLATVFHIAATVRFFRRKAKAEKFPLSTDING